MGETQRRLDDNPLQEMHGCAMADSSQNIQNELFLLEAWVSDNPGSHLFIKLAQLYHKQKRLADAAGVLQRGLAIHPNDVEARSLLAEVLQGMGDLPGAVGQLQIAAREIKRHHGIFTRLAQLCEMQGDPDYAANARQIAKALSSEGASGSMPPPEMQDTVTMAEIYAAQGYTEQAAGIYHRLLTKDPSRNDIRQRLNALLGIGPVSQVSPAQQKTMDKLEAFKQAALGRA